MTFRVTLITHYMRSDRDLVVITDIIFIFSGCEYRFPLEEVRDGKMP